MPVTRARAGKRPPERSAGPSPLDVAVVPGLLLLVARDLLLHDPPRVLAWRLPTSPAAAAAAWLAPLVPRPSAPRSRPGRAPARALAAARARLRAARRGSGARPAVRAAVLALAAPLLVVLPSAAFVAMGAATARPYGQDGGVVQLPLAIDQILAGQSPYGADYSGTILGRQARVSSFWDALRRQPDPAPPRLPAGHAPA